LWAVSRLQITSLEMPAWFNQCRRKPRVECRGSQVLPGIAADLGTPSCHRIGRLAYLSELVEELGRQAGIERVFERGVLHRVRWHLLNP
jgi:hypothetical protein